LDDCELTDEDKLDDAEDCELDDVEMELELTELMLLAELSEDELELADDVDTEDCELDDVEIELDELKLLLELDEEL
jgi:hypothetical protein